MWLLVTICLQVHVYKRHRCTSTQTCQHDITYFCLTRCKSSYSCLSGLCQTSCRVQHSCLVTIYYKRRTLKLLSEYRDVLQRNCLDCVNSVMMQNCLVYVTRGVTKYYLVLLKCLLLRNFFVFSICSQTIGHQYKLFFPATRS